MEVSLGNLAVRDLDYHAAVVEIDSRASSTEPTSSTPSLPRPGSPSNEPP